MDLQVTSLPSVASNQLEVTCLEVIHEERDDQQGHYQGHDGDGEGGGSGATTGCT